jgi:hypothetical protein
MWELADLVYRNQGRENSGYMTPLYIRRIAAAVPGLDPGVVIQMSGSPQVGATLLENARAARTAAITGTPGFRLGRTGGVLTPFGQGPTDAPAFLQRLASAIHGG